MNKNLFAFLIFLASFLLSCSLHAQNLWPNEIKAKNGAIITVYQPQPEKFENNVLRTRAAISIEPKPGADLIFGAIWANAKLNTDRETRMAELEDVKITDVRFPDETDTSKVSQLKALLEEEIPKWNLKISIDELVASIERDNPATKDALKNTPPEIIYTKKNTSLVLIDGEPKLQKDETLKMERVLNTAFLIVKANEDSKFYLYAGKWWYKSDNVKEGWTLTSKLPSSLQQIDKQIKEKMKEKGKTETEEEKKQKPPEIIVRTKPSEILQTDGEPKLSAVEGTGLLYAENSSDNIFMEIATQKYFVLLSGRWYKASSLNGPWEYNPSDSLPADFAKIPEGSEKDNVLSSVAGTPAAQEAVMDAQIPQTAKVDRKTATCTVKYDGEPKFEPIEGTNLSVAMNTSSTVLQAKGKYYCVENGIWFVAGDAKGPWKVSDDRPKDVDKIPADSPAYNVKYVYVYDSTPEVVYVGYTPGYTGSYVYGPTVVYGTGYYYNPWYGPYYYPHPVTYGFSMSYNPYMGWSMGFAFSVGFFGYGHAGYPYHGYWGAHGHYPPYHHHHHGGYYGHGGHYGNTNINIDRSNNVYNNRGGVSTRDVNRGPSAGQQPAGGSRPSAGQQPAGSRPGNQPSAGQQPAGSRPGNQPSAGQQPAGSRPGNQTSAGQQPANKNNVYSDQKGNVYRQNNDGNWQQRSNNQWQNTNRQQPAVNDMNKQQQMRDRGQTRNNNYNRSGGGGRSAPSGGSRGGGGRGGGGRR